MEDQFDFYLEASNKAFKLAHKLVDIYPDANFREVADGLLAGAIHYWLYTRQPCDDSNCLECSVAATADLRLMRLMELAQVLAQESEYYHGPNDHNAGRA